MRNASMNADDAQGLVFDPVQAHLGAMISRFSRCLRSALGTRRSMKVAMVPTPDAPAGKAGHESKNKRAPGCPHTLEAMSVASFEEVCQRHHTEVLVAPGAHGNGPVCLLLVANDQDVRDLLQRMLADFIVIFSLRKSTWL
jgi:hypothetical protein